MSLYRNPDKRLVFWNKLGTSEQVNKSEVGFDCTETGSPVYVSGKFGNAVEVATYNYFNYVNIPANIFRTNYWTIEFWIKRIIDIADDGDIYGWMVSSGANRIGFDLYNSTGRYGPQAYIVNTTDTTYIIYKYNYGSNAAMKAAFPINIWKHVAFTFDDTESIVVNKMKYYLDGTVNSLAIQATNGTGPFGGLYPGGRLYTVHGNTGDKPNAHVMDNIKIWNYPRTDFSDREIEDSQFPGKIYRNPDKKLVLWNQLGSAVQVTKSLVGPNGTIVNTPTYVACKFGNGLYVANKTDDDAVTFPWTYRPYGCIEFYYKPDYNRGEQPAFPMKLYSTLINGSRFDAFIDGLNRFVTLYPNNFGNGIYIRYTTPSFSAGDLIHIAVVWSKDIIDGSDYRKVFWNTSELSFNSGWNEASEDVTQEQTLYVGNNYLLTTGADGGVDNIKIWNYPKTDFSDRDSEYPIHFYNLNIKTNPLKKLLSWSKLGSSTEVTKNPVGPNYNEVNSPVYITGKFDNGIQCQPQGSYHGVRIPIGTFDLNYFTWEFWMYRNWEFADEGAGFIVWNHYPHSPSPAGVTNIVFYNSTGSGMWGLYLGVGTDVPQSNQYGYNSGSLSALINLFPRDTWLHVAFTMDSSLTSNDRVDMYINNVKYDCTRRTSFDPNDYAPYSTFNSNVDTGTHGITYKDTRLDNLRIWNYPKVDFSDSLNEHPVELTSLVKEV